MTMKSPSSGLIVLASSLLCAGQVVCAVEPNNEHKRQELPRSRADIPPKRLIMVVADGMHPSYFDLDRNGDNGGREGNWLLPNMREYLENSSTWFKNSKCHLPSSTDTNHLNAVAGTSCAQTGLIGVAGQLIGWDKGGQPVLRKHSRMDIMRDDLGRPVDTLFHAMKRQYRDAKTAIVSGKIWVAELFRNMEFNGGIDSELEGQDVIDYVVTGRSIPENIIEPPHTQNYIDPSTDTDPQCDIESWQQKFISKMFFSSFPKNFPSDEWLVDATLALFDSKKPDMIYIDLAQMDTLCHAFGAAWDPDEFEEKPRHKPVGCGKEYSKYYVSSRNKNAYRDPILDNVRDVDRQFGRLVEGFEKRGILDDATVVVFSDHSMINHNYDRLVLPQKTDFKKVLQKANLIGKDDFFSYNSGTAGATLYWREGKERVADAKAVLESYQTQNPETGQKESPWFVLDRNDMKKGISGVSLPGELYHTYFVEVDKEKSMVWPDLMLLGKNGWQFPIDEWLYFIFGIQVKIPLPSIMPFVGGHGSVDTLPNVMAFSLPENRKGAVCTEEVFISDIVPTIAALLNLTMMSTTIGRDLNSYI